jgi:hypothetical protein
MTSVEDTEEAAEAMEAAIRVSTVAIGTKPGHRCKAIKASSLM